RAAGHDRIDAVGRDVRAHEQLAGRLHRRVWRPRVEPVGLAGVAGLDRAVDLVGRDLEVANGLGPSGARLADRLEQDVDAHDARPDERLRVEDRAVDVRLRGEVHDGVRVGDEWPDGVRVRDVALDEAEASGTRPVAVDLGEVRAVARVRQLVENRDPRPVVTGQDVADVARADEAGPARDEEPGKGAGRGHGTGRSTGGARLPAWSSSRAISAARINDSTVP